MLDVNLFDDPLPPLPEPSSELFAEVVLNRPVRAIYTYRVPDHLVERIVAGKRLRVPFGRGNKPEVGYCVRVTDTTSTTGPLKFIDAILDDVPLVSRSMLKLTEWIADYYYCGWGQVLDAALPRAVKDEAGGRWLIHLDPSVSAGRDLATLTPKQQQVMETLRAFDRPARLEETQQLARVGPSVIRALVKAGWINVIKQRVDKITAAESLPRSKPHVLSHHQTAACEKIARVIHAGTYQTFLLHGVTGSGKTEVYLRSIAETAKRGREAIVLVPEISLTPQTIDRFRRRFDNVAVLHSHLTDPERHHYWKAIAKGEIQVVIGARSAIFAPCQKLGLIIIDEEHESTFKQETTPRYHARDVARERARLESIPLVLGSATPALESWIATERGEAELLSLPERVGTLQFPVVQGIDLREEYRQQKGLASIGPRLAKAVHECIASGGQTILLLNRRGFAPAIVCPQCGEAETCPHCDIALTFHKNRGLAICHSCDTTRPAPRVCSSCGHKELKLTGFGTQRLEDEVRARFPNARIERMDSDTMRSPGHYERVLSAFRANEVDILLGTQMIAKGLDFPNVRLVGVISADTARHLPDFRASEKTFQLIVQVSGRAGRGTDPGRVLVQTYNPDDQAIQCALRGDYQQFLRGELPLRREFHYPPFGKLTRIIIRAKSEAVARDGAEQIATSLKAHLTPGVEILGPAPAPVTKVRDYYRHHLQIHTPDAPTRARLLEAALSSLSLPSAVEYVVDVDPLDLL